MLPLPLSQLSPNFRGQTRGKKAAAVRQYRSACGHFYRTWKIPQFFADGIAPEKPLIIHLDFYLAPRYVNLANGKRHKIKDNLYRPTDEDSARGSFKSGQDALIDAGIIPDDNNRFVKSGETRLFRTQKEHNGKVGVLLTIETQ